MTKQNYIEPLVTTRKPTPEEWLANHERLHNEDNTNNLYRIYYRPTYMHPSETPDWFECRADSEQDAEHECLNHYPESQIVDVELRRSE